MEKIRRRLFGRVGIWDPKTETVIDVSTRKILAFGGPSEAEEYGRLATGDREVLGRELSVEVPIISSRVLDLLEVFVNVDKTLKCAFVGLNGTDTWLWLEPTQPSIQTPSVDPASFAEKVLRLNTSVFYPAIWSGNSVISGVPWRSTNQQQRDGNNVLRITNGERPGYNGPLWKVPAGASVDLGGKISGVSSNNPATLQFEFPFPRLQLKLESDRSFDAELFALDSDGAILSSDTSSLKLPSGTFQIRVEVYSASSKVYVVVGQIGSSLGISVNGLPEPGSLTTEDDDTITTETSQAITVEQ